GRRVVAGIVAAGGRTVRARAVLSNAGLKNTIFRLVGEQALPPEYAEAARAVRVNTSSCQVYFGIRKGESIPHIGDLVFVSQAPHFSSAELTSLRTTSRTFSVYYPETRPGSDRYTIVASINSRHEDWTGLSDEAYAREKARLVEDSLAALERLIPGVREKIDWTEAATPRTIERYTTHWGGASFGTKFEGLKVSAELPEAVPGMYHAGSVGIIMSGWLGTINYGVIVADRMDRYLSSFLPNRLPTRILAPWPPLSPT
ncbi:MAG: phytoene desaturase family protein, partial [Opitutaceae bacterium]